MSDCFAFCSGFQGDSFFGASATVPSLTILAVKVRFSHNREAKMLPPLLKCFPRLETLHIMPIPSESPDSVHDLEFWESLGSCECLESHLKTVVLHGFLSQNHESLFLMYICRKSKALKTVGVVCSDEWGGERLDLRLP